jgi:FAD binding domain
VNQRTTLTMQLSDLTWSSTFSSKHFVVSQHRQGRVFMAGDAAHLHSPVGGQGLNSGIQDAYNLMWKLALIQRRKALPGLLESYSVERHKTAQNLIEKVGMATKIVTLKNPLAQQLRNQLAGMVLNTERMRNRMGRGVAMLDIEYKDSPSVAEDLLSNSMLDRVLGRFKYMFNDRRPDFRQGPSAGMRAPNVLMPSDGATHPASLFDFYRGTHYTLMIFAGVTRSPAVDTLLEIGAAIQTRYQASIQPYVVAVESPLNVHGNKHIIVDAEQSIHRSYVAWQPCLYLIRPDKHIGYRSETIDVKRLTTYLDRILVHSHTS